jgi:hypothetical protein
MNWRKSLSVMVVACAAWSCGSNGEKAPTEPAGPLEQAKSVEAPKPAVAEPAKPPPAMIEETTFRLASQGAPQYGADKDEKFRVVLEARGGYHVNEDYPIRVDLKAPAGVKLAKPSLVRADAAAFGTESASFDVAFSAPKGEHEVVATVDFAVCTKETCVPDQRTVAVKLSVL